MVSSSSSSSEKSASSFQNVIFLLSFQTPILFNIRESRDKKYAKPLVLLLLVVERRRKQRVCRDERERLRRASLCAHVYTNEESALTDLPTLRHPFKSLFKTRPKRVSSHRKRRKKRRKKTLFGLFFSRPKKLFFLLSFALFVLPPFSFESFFLFSSRSLHLLSLFLTSPSSERERERTREEKRETKYENSRRASRETRPLSYYDALKKKNTPARSHSF